jgi:hypothetical protein
MAGNDLGRQQRWFSVEKGFFGKIISKIIDIIFGGGYSTSASKIHGAKI